MAAADGPRAAAALVEDLASLQAAAHATLVHAARSLAPLHLQHLPVLFPCPSDSRHRVPAAALAAHTAACHAARHSLQLQDLPSCPSASAFWYADAPAVVHVRVLPIDQQPEAGPIVRQQERGSPASGAAESQPPAAMPALLAALRAWEETGTARSSLRCLAELEVAAWHSLPLPLPAQVGRLLAAVPPHTLAPLVRTAAAEAGVGVTAGEAQALGTLMAWYAQAATTEKGDRSEPRLLCILAAVAPYAPPGVPAASFLLALWQSLLSALLHTLPRCKPPPPPLTAAQAEAALEQLREGTRSRQQQEQAAQPQRSRGERLALYDAAVQAASAERAQRPAYRPLPDTDWLFRPHTPGQPQGGPGCRSRVELLAELRDLKRRTTSYRARKQRTPLQSARELIELRMLQLEEAWGPGKQSTADAERRGRHAPAAHPCEDSRGWQGRDRGQREAWQDSRAGPCMGPREGTPRAREEDGRLWTEQERGRGSEEEETGTSRKNRNREKGVSSGRHAEDGRRRHEERDSRQEGGRRGQEQRGRAGVVKERDGSREALCQGREGPSMHEASERGGARGPWDEGEMGRWGDEEDNGAHLESERTGGSERRHRDHLRKGDHRDRDRGLKRHRTHM